MAMNTIGIHNTAIGLKPPASSPLSTQKSPIPLVKPGASQEELHEKFTQFVGETFYGQMFKAMRSTVGKPAYFNGGRAEEVFQGQLDQTMAQSLTKSTADTFAEPMFERQFPQFAGSRGSENTLSQLSQLSRR